LVSLNGNAELGDKGIGCVVGVNGPRYAGGCCPGLPMIVSVCPSSLSAPTLIVTRRGPLWGEELSKASGESSDSGIGVLLLLGVVVGAGRIGVQSSAWNGIRKSFKSLPQSLALLPPEAGPVSSGCAW